MQEIFSGVNWLAVVAGFVVAFALGFLWYGYLFRKAWMAGHGLEAPPERMPVAATLLQIAGTFLLAWLFGITAARDALLTIVLVVLTIMCLMTAGALYAQKPPKVAAIEAGYVLAAGVVMFLAQAIL